jgi:murein DD-endopeptidase MepM/ murein hydrolase activator NlpD
MPFSVGSATVDIVPDARGFQQKLDAQLRNVQIKVEAAFDDNGVKQKIEQVTKGVTAQIKVDVDDRVATAKVEAVAKSRTAKVTVTADVAAAQASVAKLQGLIKDRQLKIGVDTAAANVKVTALQQQISSTKAEIAANVDDVEARARLKSLQSELSKTRNQLEIDTAPARAEIAAFEVELAQAKVELKVQVDAAKAQAELDAVARQREATYVANVNKAYAEAILEDLARTRVAGYETDVDSAHAEAILEDLQRTREVHFVVDIDKARAMAIKEDIAREKAMKIRVDVDSSDLARLGATASASTGIIGALAAAGAALGPTIVPAAGAAAAAILAIGPAAITSAGGIGVLVAGLRNVFGAVSETLKAQDAIGLSAMKSARTQVDSASQVAAAQQALEGAEAGLANARATASAAAARSAQAIIDAQQGIKDATIEAARDVQEAQQRAADSVQSAVNRQVAAERTLSQALLSEEQAQRSLSDARRQAKRDLEDINNSLADGQLSQRQAALDVQTTYDALVQSQDSGSRIEREQAQLAYDRATQRQKELAQDQARLGDDAKKANKAGVEGSPQVEAAKRDLAVAQAAVKDARVAFVEASNGIKKAQADGQKAIAEAQERGAKAINAAERSLSDARKARTEQQRQSAYSVEQAQRGVVSAQRSLADASQKTAASSDAAASALDRQAAALAKLSPEGRALAAFLTGTFIPAYTDFIRDVIEPPLAGGLLQFFKEAEPALRPIQSLFENLAVALGDLFVAAGKALGSSFWVDFFDLLADQAGPATKGVGQFVGNILTGLAGLMTAFQPIAKGIGGFLLDISKQFRDFGTGASGGLQKFIKFIQDNGADVAGDLGAIAKAFGDIFVAAAPIGVTVLNVLGDLARRIDDLDPKVLTGIVTGILGIVATIGSITAIISIFSAVGSAIAFIANPLGLVVVGVTLLAIGFGVLYKKSKPFQEFIDTKLLPALKGVARQGMLGLRTAIDIVSDALKRNKPTIDAMREALKRVGDFIIRYIIPTLGTSLRLAFIAIGIIIGQFIGIVTALYRAFVKANEIILPKVKELGRSIRSLYDDYIKPAWENGIKPTLKAMAGYLTEDLPKAFKNGVEAVGRAWDGIKAIAQKPIKFVVNTVLEDGILKGFRAISKLVGFDAGANFHITKMATGGILPGYTPGRDVHRFVSPTAGVLDLSGGEGIARPELVRAIGGERWDAANKAARQGRVDEGLRYLGGFAEGTRRLFRPVRGGRITQGIHGSPPAIDFGVPVGSPIAAGAAGRVVRSEDLRGYEPRNSVQNGFRSYGRVIEVLSNGFRMLYAHLSRRDVNVGQNVAGGQILGLSGNTGRSSGPHLHYGVSGLSPFDFVNGSTSYSRGSSGSSGKPGSLPGASGDLPTALIGDDNVPIARDYVGELRDRMSKPLAKLNSLGGSLWEKAAKKIPPFLASKLIARVKKLADKVTGDISSTDADYAPGAFGKGTGRVTGATSAVTEAAARLVGPKFGFSTIGTYPGHQPTQTKALDFMIKSKGQGDAASEYMKAHARQMGVNYLIWNRRIWNIERAAEGWRRYFDGGSSNPSRAHTNHVHASFYDKGGWLQPGTTVVQNNTGKPEPVFNPTQWKLLERMASGQGGRGGGRTVHIEKVETADHRSLARDIQSQWLLEDALYPTWG